MSKQPISVRSDSVKTKPIQEPASRFAALFSYKPIVLFTLIVFVLILSTSFQSGRNETVRIESESLTTDLINGLKTIFSETTVRPQTGRNAQSIAMYNEVRQFYMLKAYRPAWTSFNHLNRNGASLISLIENAREYGLEPIHYHIDKLKEIRLQLREGGNRSSRNEKRMELEMLMTDAALKLMVNLHCGYGAFDSASLSSEWTGKLPQILLQGIIQGKPVEQILSVQPRFIEYSRLQSAAADFVRNTILTDDTLLIAEPVKDSSEFYSQVENALARLGYVHKNCRRKEISEGLKEFQAHHGLESDGRPGRNTMAALQMTTMHHYRMLALNLDRLRKQDNSEMHLLYVNIPAYKLKVFRQNKLVDTYRVIVGTPKTPTPQLISRVERVISNPVWDVPVSIAHNELLPKIKADTGYLRRNNFRLVDRRNKTVNAHEIDLDQISNAEYFIRQDASSDNALGKVKFIFSNPYAVYLHDTPGRMLFAKDTRDLSHGCIRLQDPERLAGYLLNSIQSDSTDISGMISKGIHREFNLSVAVPIHISYITCDADEKGNLYFYRDIYGTDEKELSELQSFMGI